MFLLLLFPECGARLLKNFKHGNVIIILSILENVFWKHWEEWIKQGVYRYKKKSSGYLEKVLMK